MKNMRLALQTLVVIVIVMITLTNFSTAHASGQPQCSRTVPAQFVCLTVDDGFSIKSIQSILTTLKKHNVKCTFFIVGGYLTRSGYQALWRQAILDGHEICYHTMKHQRVTGMDRNQIIADIAAWENAAHKVLGDSYKIPKYARLPGGAGSFDARILKVYTECGYQVIRWNVDTLTGPASYSNSIPRYVRGNARKGSIILTHFDAADASAMPRYLKWLNQTYKLVRISDAFSVPPKPLPEKKRNVAHMPPRESHSAPQMPPRSFTQRKLSNRIFFLHS